MPQPHSTLRVALPVAGPDRSYDVHVGTGLLARLGEFLPAALGRRVSRVFLVVDAGLPLDVVQSVYESLVSREIRFYADGFTPSERVKTLDTASRLLKSLTRWNADRNEPVVVIGGGIVGDVGGFVAASYRRGVPFIQCPTTLLSMVDASVGGKTGVNVDVGRPGSPDLKKNMAGAFHQPRLVLADVGVLRSLPARELRAGLAECIKHAMIEKSIPAATPDASTPAEPPSLSEALRAWLPSALNRDPEALTPLVLRNARLKARVVEQDEREEAPDAAGGRALLNLGHTFGHAIETLPGLSLPDATPIDLLHGEAVGLGLLAACRAGAALGMCPPAIEHETRDLLTRAGLPDRVIGLPPNPAIIERMTHDKKTRGGTLRLILPTGEGTAGVVAGPPREVIAAGIDAIRA